MSATLESPLALLDLDGPILDVSPRYHGLHVTLVERFGGRPLDAATYWEAKRARVPEGELWRRSGLGAEARRADAERLRLIETRDWLARDRAWPWAASTLRVLRERGFRVVVVTQRQHRGLAHEQLVTRGLDELIDVLIAGRGDDSDTAKVGLVRDADLALGEPTIFVGDTEVDLRSGRALGTLTVGVRCGIRNEERLAACDPDILLDDLRDLPPWLAEVVGG